MPDWMEPYRELIESDLGGNTTEELINDHKTNGFNNIVRAGLICMADSKVGLMGRLHVRGLLKPPSGASDVRALTPDKHAILTWLAYYDSKGVGPVGAMVLAKICCLGPRGMGARLRALEDVGYVRRHVVRKATPLSDAKHVWEISDRGREVLADHA